MISSICDAALTYGFADDVRLISEDIIERVVTDNELLKLSAKQDEPGLNCAIPGYPSDLCVPFGAQAADLIAGLRALETRVKVLELAERDGATPVLLQLLAEEKERSNRNGVKAALLEMKCKHLTSQMAELKKAGGASALLQPQEPRKIWRLIRGEKS